MNAIARPNKCFASALALKLVHAASICVVPAGALAQANACDQLKATLAARYGLPTLPFKARPSSTRIDNSLVGDQALIDRLFGGLAGFLSLASIAFAYKILRKRDGMGGGDPKLLGAIGFWLGWQQLPFVVLLAASASLIAVLLLYFRTKESVAGLRFPFGAALAVTAFGIGVVGIA